MPSFDVVSKVDMQEVDNACNNVKKEAETRYDFKGVQTDITLNKKDAIINVSTGDEMKVRAICELLSANFVRRKIDPKCLTFSDPEATSLGRLKFTATIQQGISKEHAQKIVKVIKDKKLKVQAAIQDEQVRVTGKKIDELQEVIGILRDAKIDIPLQFINMK